MKRKKVMIALLVLVIVAGAFAPAVFAQKTNSKASGKEVVDPFTLRVLVLDDAPDGTALKVTEAQLTRLAIRIPERPPLRSAFRPSY